MSSPFWLAVSTKQKMDEEQTKADACSFCRLATAALICLYHLGPCSCVLHVFVWLIIDMLMISPLWSWRIHSNLHVVLHRTFTPGVLWRPPEATNSLYKPLLWIHSNRVTSETAGAPFATTDAVSTSSSLHCDRTHVKSVMCKISHPHYAISAVHAKLKIQRCFPITQHKRAHSSQNHGH